MESRGAALAILVLLASVASAHVLSLQVEPGNVSLRALFNFQAPGGPIEIRITRPDGTTQQGFTDPEGWYSFRPTVVGNYTMEAVAEPAGGHLHYDKQVLYVPGAVAEAPLWQRLSNSLGYVVGLGGILWGYLVWRRAGRRGR